MAEASRGGGDHFPVARPALLPSGPVRGRAGASASAPLSRPAEPTDQDVAAFYDKLLPILKDVDAFRNGDWSQIDPLPAWHGNFSSEGFVSYAWAGKDEARYVAVMNYADNRGQCYLRLPFPELEGRQLLLTDLMGSEVYHRDGGDLVHRGLYVDQAPWQINVFELRSISAAA